MRQTTGVVKGRIDLPQWPHRSIKNNDSGSQPLDDTHRRRLAPEAVVSLDWHNDMSKLILVIKDEIERAADDRARGVVIRRLRRALESES